MAIIPISYQVGYHVALIFHEPYVPTSGGGMDFYNMIYPMLGFYLCCTIPIMLWFFEYMENNKMKLGIHLIYFCSILLYTLTDFKYRPYEHSLLMGSVASTLVSRPLLNFVVNKYFCKQ